MIRLIITVDQQASGAVQVEQRVRFDEPTVGERDVAIQLGLAVKEVAESLVEPLH